MDRLWFDRSGCLSEAGWVDYLSRPITAYESGVLESHLAQCPRCWRILMQRRRQRGPSDCSCCRREWRAAANPEIALPIPQAYSSRRTIALTVLVTDTRTQGGIPRFNRFLLNALAVAAAERRQRLNILSLNDTPTALFTNGANGAFRFYGAQGRRLRFFLNSLRGALLSDFLLVGHVSLAPVARFAKLWKPRLGYGVVAHGIEAWDLSSRLIRTALHSAHFILAVSRFTRRKLIEQGFRSEQVIVFPNTVDGQVFFPSPPPESLRQKYKLTARSEIILTVGRLAVTERAKGFEITLKAFRRLRPTHPHAQLIVVGEGDYRPALHKLAMDMGIAEYVHFPGAVTDAVLRNYYNLCDVFVLPSQKEGFGIVFLEALACGKPVIAGNQDGARDPLLDGQLGVLVNPEDDSALADALHNVLTGAVPARLKDPDCLRRTVLAQYSCARFQARVRVLLDWAAQPQNGWGYSQTSPRVEAISPWEETGLNRSP